MFKNITIISSHPRSGTHFLIDSIQLNLPKISFPRIRPSYATLENIILPHDKELFGEWINWLEKCDNEELNPIIKTHCLPSDLISYTELMKEKKEAHLVRNILESARFIYIEREPVTCLRSWFEFVKSGGVVPLSSASSRLKELDFEEFLSIESLHKMPHREWGWFDENVVKYLAQHHFHWREFIKENNGLNLKFTDLKNDFDSSLKKIALFMGLPLRVPELEKPFSQESAKILRRINRVLIKLKLNFILSIFTKLNKIEKSTSVPPKNKVKISIKDQVKKRILSEYSESFKKL